MFQFVPFYCKLVPISLNINPKYQEYQSFFAKTCFFFAYLTIGPRYVPFYYKLVPISLYIVPKYQEHSPFIAQSCSCSS